jgi:tetratricopeptide (TPR) repeat protein
MARAHAQLPTMPDGARRAAEEADKALPGRAAPAVVLARAALAMGDATEAARAFERARAIDPRSVEDPATMHDLGRALRKTGKRDEALVVYRALVPRIDLLGTASVRVSVLLEAAHVSIAAEGAGTAPPTMAELAKGKPAKADTRPRTPPLDEAIAYLREARQRPATQLAGDVLLSLALTLDRAGSRDEADAVLAEAERAGVHVKGAPLDYLAVPEDRAALEALASESSDRPAAQKAWEAFLAGPGGKGPWASAARTRLDLLKRGVVRPGRAAKPGKPR